MRVVIRKKIAINIPKLTEKVWKYMNSAELKAI